VSSNSIGIGILDGDRDGNFRLSQRTRTRRWRRRRRSSRGDRLPLHPYIYDRRIGAELIQNTERVDGG
ncbi:hypothetical protein GBA52_004073, partial [Prunus armeniaca]